MSIFKIRKNKIITTKLVVQSADDILSPFVIQDSNENTLMEIPITGGERSVITTAAVANAETVADTLADITGLSFAVAAATLYYFKAVIPYTAAATTTGARFTIDGPADPTVLNYMSTYTLTATTQTVNYATAYSIPAAANATSLAAGNVAIIEGIIKPSVAGTVKVQFASEVTKSAITALAGALLVYRKLS